jgi:hypothetical protein
MTDDMPSFSLKDGLSDRELLVRIATQLEDLTRRVDESTKAFMTAARDHEARLRALEKFQWTILGAAALVSFVIATLSRVMRF